MQEVAVRNDAQNRARAFELVGNANLDPSPARTADILEACRLASAVGQHQASRAASVPRTTLHRWLVAMQHSSNPLRRGHPTLLDLESERRLVALALTRQALNCPLTKPALGLLAAAVAKAQDKKFATANGEPSEDWWHGFLKRWPALVARSTSRLSSDSLVRPTEERLVPWFELVKTIQAVVPRERWFNIDESQCRGDPAKVLVARGSKHVHSAKPGYKGHVTLVPCVSATGQVLAPLFIFQGKTATLDLLEGGPEKAAVAVTGAPTDHA